MKREIVIALSQIGLKKVTSNYMGMRLVSPTIYGMVNGGFISPGEFWMSDCLEAFIATGSGAVLDVGANKGVCIPPPFRTRSSSPSAPMVLGINVPGRAVWSGTRGTAVSTMRISDADSGPNRTGRTGSGTGPRAVIERFTR